MGRSEVDGRALPGAVDLHPGRGVRRFSDEAIDGRVVVRRVVVEARSTHANSAAVASGAPGQPAGIGAQASAAPSAPAAAAAEPDAKPARPVAKQVASAAAAPSAAPTTGSIGREGPVTAIVPSVTGAPGDGSTSLTAAIQQRATSKGVQLARPAHSARLSRRGQRSPSARPRRASSRSISSGWCAIRRARSSAPYRSAMRSPQARSTAPGARRPTQAAGAAAQGIVKLLPQAKAVN